MSVIFLLYLLITYIIFINVKSDSQYESNIKSRNGNVEYPRNALHLHNIQVGNFNKQILHSPEMIQHNKYINDKIFWSEDAEESVPLGECW